MTIRRGVEEMKTTETAKAATVKLNLSVKADNGRAFVRPGMYFNKT
jgi:hypothetical protein